ASATAAVAAAPVAAATQPSQPESPGPAARQLLKKARQSLQAGNLAQARQYVAQAKTYKVEYGWWEDNPDKVMDDVLRAAPRLSDTPAPAQAKGSTPAKALDVATASAKRDEPAPKTPTPKVAT